jgi:hypothetical protein
VSDAKPERDEQQKVHSTPDRRLGAPHNLVDPAAVTAQIILVGVHGSGGVLPPDGKAMRTLGKHDSAAVPADRSERPGEGLGHPGRGVRW